MANFFLEIFNLSLAACWLIAAIVAVRAIFVKSMPKWLVCCLWGLVAVRLLVPITFESNISLVPNQQLELYAPSEGVSDNSVFVEESVTVNDENRVDGSLSAPIADETISAPVQDEDVSFPVVGGEVSAPITEGEVSAPITDENASYPVADENVSSPVTDETVSSPITDETVSVPEQNTVIGEQNTTQNGTNENVNIQNNVHSQSVERSNQVSHGFARIGFTVWAIGFFLMCEYSVVSYILIKKRVSMSFPCGDKVRKGEGVDSPFIFGLFRPRIYIPFGLSQRTEECVIAHERAHLKRRDYLVKPFAFLVLSVHWFNPFVWLAYILLCRDIEYACDEKVVRGLDPDARKAYAFALLECAVSHRRITACPVAFGETGVKERVKNTMKYKKPAFWIIIICVIVCIAVAVLFLTTSSSESEASEDSTETSGESSSEVSKDEENDVYAQVYSLINESKFEEAYKLLLTVKTEQRAKDMLNDFLVVFETESRYGRGNNGTSLFDEIKSEYDKNGNLIKVTDFGHDRDIQSVTQMSYDEDNNLLTKDIYYSGAEKPKISIKYTYDSNGWLIKELRTDRNENGIAYDEVFEYVYDSNGNVIERRTINNFGFETVETVKYVLKYDESGRLIEKYNEEDPEYVTYYTYYEDGILKKEESEGWLKEYDANGNIVKSDTGDEKDDYVYNQDGKLSKHTSDDGKSVTVYEYTYDENGYLVKKTADSDEYGVTTWTYYNDEFGNPEKVALTYDSGNDDGYTFHYSGYKYFYRPQKKSEGNWEQNPNDSVQKDYIDGLFAAEFVEYEDLGKYEYCERFVSDKEYNVMYVLITPKTAIYDFKIHSLVDNIEDVTLENILFEAKRISAQKPLLAEIEFGDILAENGISFIDENGNTHLYKLVDSAYDGKLIVSKTKAADSEESKSEASESEASEPETSEPETSEPEVSDPEPHVHVYGEWKTVTAATCQSTGVVERTCACGDKQLQSVNMTQHKYVNGVCSCGAIESASDVEDGALTFSLVDGGYKVSGWNFNGSQVVIPSTFKGKPVVEIAQDAFGGNRNIERVVIPKTVKTIGDEAFMNCFFLREIVFEEESELTSIGEHAFYGSALTSVVLPEGLTTIGSAAFHSCDDLKEITLPSTLRSIGSNAFRYSTVSKVIVNDAGKWSTVSFDKKYANPAYVAGNLYSPDGSLVTTVYVPNGTTEISAYAFCGVKTIESVRIPSTVKSIGVDAFAECKSLDVYITDLAKWAQVSVASADSLPGKRLFLNGAEIKDVVIPSGVTSIGSYAFSFASLTSVNMPDTVKTIGEGAFHYCTNLQSIRLSNNLTEIPKNMLYGASKLKNVVIPDTVKAIGESAFEGCTSLESMFIPASVTYIGEDAFENACDSMKEFEFEVKDGWVCAATGGDYTVRASDLATTYNTIAKIKDYNFAPWVRR